MSMRNQCLLCNSTHHLHVYTGEFGHEVHLCRDCGFLFAARHVDPASLHALLRHGYADRAGELEDAWVASHRIEAVRRRIHFLKAFVDLPQAPRVLEVGSYIGHFLYAGMAEGWQMEGIEPEERTADFANEKSGALVHTCLVEEFVSRPPRQFDGICLFHVLEHLPNPVQILSDLRRLVTEDGWLCLEVPNGDLCGEGDWYRFFNADETHLWFFSSRTLRSVLARAGWQLEKVNAVPAYAGPKGALLVLAYPAAQTESVNLQDPALARSMYRRLRLLRLSWLVWKGPWRRLCFATRYTAWRIVKGWRQERKPEGGGDSA